MRLFLVLTTCMCMTLGCVSLSSEMRNVPDEQMTKILSESLEPLGMDYGYSTRLETAYFYFSGTDGVSQDKQDKNVREFANVLDKYSESDVSVVYSEVYRVNEICQYLMSYYKTRKNWTEYNYVKNELSRPSQYLMTQVDGYFKAKYPKTLESIQVKKPEIRKDAILMYQEKFTLVDYYY